MRQNTANVSGSLGTLHGWYAQQMCTKGKEAIPHIPQENAATRKPSVVGGQAQPLFGCLQTFQYKYLDGNSITGEYLMGCQDIFGIIDECSVIACALSHFAHSDRNFTHFWNETRLGTPSEFSVCLVLSVR